MNRKFVTALFLLSPSFAFAHPGHVDSFVAAFAHPFTGIDHLLMMLCVGIFAARIGDNVRWQLPLAFLSAMMLGWAIAAAGYSFAHIESGIAAGLIALGVMLVWRMNLPFALQASAIALFALLHGMAHGAELAAALPAATSFGFLLATGLLHAAGLCIGTAMSREYPTSYRVLGVLLSAIGGGLLLAA